MANEEMFEFDWQLEEIIGRVNNLKYCKTFSSSFEMWVRLIHPTWSIFFRRRISGPWKSSLTWHKQLKINATDYIAAKEILREGPVQAYNDGDLNP